MIAAAFATGVFAQDAPDRRARLDEMVKRADQLDARADLKAYRAAWEEALAFARTVYPADHPRLAALEGELASVRYLEGDVRGALAMSEPLIVRLRSAGPEWNELLTSQLNGIVVYLMTLGEHARAREVATEVLARRQAQYGAAPHRQVAAAYGNLAQAELEFGNYDRAIELLQRAIDEGRRALPASPNLPLYLANLPIYLGAAGRLEDAVEAAQTASDAFPGLIAADHPTVAQNLSTLARLQLQLGRPQEAVETARRASDLAAAKLGRTNQQTASYGTIFAEALVQAGRPAEGRVIAEASVQALTGSLGADADRTLLAREAQAAALAALGERAQALAIRADVAERRARRFPRYHRDRIGGGDRGATAAALAGDIDVAIATQAETQALRAAVYPADDSGLLAGEARLAALEARGRRPGAARRAAAAVAQLDVRAARLRLSGATRTGLERELRRAFAWALDAAVTERDADTAFALLQRVTDHATARTSADGWARAAADPATAAALREQQDAAVALERTLDRQLRLVGRGQDTTAIAAERVALGQRLAAATARLAALSPAANDAAPVPMSLAAARAALAADEALLVVAPGPLGVVTMAVTRDAATLARADLAEDAFGATVAALRASMAPDTAFDASASARLYRALFPDPVRRTLARHRRLLIVAGGASGALPFAALSPGKSHWLIRTHAPIHLTGIAALALPRQRGGGDRLANFVGFGAPQLAGNNASMRDGVTPYRSASVARGIATLPALPATATELATLGRTLGASRSTVLTGAAATEAAVRAADLSGIVAFATHGLMPGELDGLEEPALVMTPAAGDDGILSMAEIMRLRIAADWVILSACNTAGGGGADDASLSGLARAFLHAGARNLMVSQWAIRDDVATRLSTRTIAAYREGAEPADALRAAMLATIARRSGRADTTHPRYWAPFVIVGR